MARLEEIRGWIGTSWSEVEATELTVRIAALGTNDREQWARVVDDFTANGARTAPDQALAAAARHLRRTEEAQRGAREALHHAVRAAAEAGMPRGEVARLAKISRTTVNRILDGRRDDGPRPAADRPAGGAQAGNMIGAGEKATREEPQVGGSLDGTAAGAPDEEEDSLGVSTQR